MLRNSGIIVSEKFNVSRKCNLEEQWAHLKRIEGSVLHPDASRKREINIDYRCLLNWGIGKWMVN